jgi:alpha-beta hydrolase superfamily lysophospholipase
LPKGNIALRNRKIDDIQTFVGHITTTYGIPVQRMSVVARSVRAVLATTWAHDYAPRIRCLGVASPAFKVKLYVPLPRPGLRLMHRLRGKFFVNSYVKPKFLTHDPQRIASYRQARLITRPIAVNSCSISTIPPSASWPTPPPSPHLSCC